MKKQKKTKQKFSISGRLTSLFTKPKPVHKKEFISSADYWQKRYAEGGDSGDGSYNDLACFKAKILNEFVKENGIQTVIEYGCGDGNQLSFATYPSYLGFDVSPEAVSICTAKFAGDATKGFKLIGDYAGEKAHLTLSLDVIFHLVEDEVYNTYMERLFSSSDQFVIIYSSNTDDNEGNKALHVKHRCFATWVEGQPQWTLWKYIPNQSPYNPATKKGSFADFYIYKREEGPDRA